MKRAACVLFLAGALAAHGDNLVAGDSDVGSYWLSAVTLRGSALEITRSEEDRAFEFQLGHDAPVSSPAGSVVQIPFDRVARFSGPESSLEFLPYPPGSRNLFLVEATNRRGDVWVGILRRAVGKTSLSRSEVRYVGLEARSAPVDDRAELSELEKSIRE